MMQLTINSEGLLQGDLVKYIESPFYDERPNKSAPDLLVIHNISLPAGVFGQDYIHQLFTGKLRGDEHPSFSSLIGLQVSAHVLINRGGLITQFVPFTKRAWHAGVSEFEGQSACNDFSIGIELEGTDTWVYTEINTLVLYACSNIDENYASISLHRVVGHSCIAPGRKTDPGKAFDWDYFLSVYRLYFINLSYITRLRGARPSLIRDAH